MARIIMLFPAPLHNHAHDYAPVCSIKRMEGSPGAKRHQPVREKKIPTRETGQVAAAERALRYPTAEEEQIPGLEDDAW